MNRFTNVVATPLWGVESSATGERRTAHSAVATATAIAVSILISSGNAFGQTASCPPTQPQTTKTEKPTTQSKPHQATKQRAHTHGGGGTGVGVGVNVDLGGIGQRRPEADPFAVSGGPSTSRTQEKPEKPKTKKTEHDVAKSDPFANVELTGAQAKDQTHDR